MQKVLCEKDASRENKQLLKNIQFTSTLHPDGIILEPVGGTGLPQVAGAAAAAGIGWVVLNRDVEYLADLRRAYRVPLFAITSDHFEVGCIQGRQLAALLPTAESLLVVKGPSDSLVATQRFAAM